MDAVLSSDFYWDGTTSDLAQQYYRAYASLSASGSLASAPAAVSLSNEQLPDKIQRRLAAHGLRFEQLPSLLQRALIWDSGFVFGAGSDLLQVYTTGNRSMAQLAVPLESFLRAGCTAKNCTNEFRSQFCKGSQMLSVANCVADDIIGSDTNTAMWATGSGRINSTEVGDEGPVIPEMKLVRHYWVDGIPAVYYTVYAIHTVPPQRQPAWSQCPQANLTQTTGLTVPCGIYRTVANQSRWQPPPTSDLVTKWLELTQQELKNDSGMKTEYIVIIVVGSVLLLLLAAFGVWWRRQKRQAQSEASDTAAILLVSADGQIHGKVSEDHATFHSSTTPTSLRKSHQAKRSSTPVDGDAANSALKPLVTDPILQGKRLTFDEIAFQRQISRGAFGEVWLANYKGNQVAVKRIRQEKRPKFQDIEDFTSEIRLTATLSHAHLVQFVGVAWRSIDTLCMVTEYMANGDLQGYLNSHSDTLAGFWTAEKTGIALGVARALAYLHSLSPPLIHRDVKAKNVLLDEELSPRLMDFGVSKLRQLDRTMTSGIGTPFWTAPEIVEGVRYTESSDIYSFGVLLTELETCQLPYFDHQSRQDLQYDPPSGGGDRGSNTAATAGGGESTPASSSSSQTPPTKGSTSDTPVPASLRPFLILNLVMSGSLRPSLSPKCPEWLRELANSCFRADPAARPTAEQIAEVLARQWSILE